MYLRCGKQWEYRYVRGIISPPSAALTVGSSFHRALKHNFTQKITSGIDLPKEELLDVYSADFEQRAVETEWGGDDKGEQKDMGAKLVELHREKLAPTIQPEKVEEKFTLETDKGFDLGGTIDLIEKDGTVVDSKTSGKRYEEDSIARKIQPALYDFAYEALTGKKAAGFRYDVVLKLKTKAETQQIRSEVTPEDRSWMINTVNNVHKAMEAGVAMPAPEAPGVWWCSEKFCGYWNMCKGKNRRPKVEEVNRKLDGIFPVKRRTDK